MRLRQFEFSDGNSSVGYAAFNLLHATSLLLRDHPTSLDNITSVTVSKVDLSVPKEMLSGIVIEEGVKC